MEIIIYMTVCSTFQNYVEIWNTNTNKIVVTTSVIAAIRPNTKLSGLYPLAQHSFEMKYANIKAAPIYYDFRNISEGALQIRPQ